jgi:hypothetical protein
LGNVGGKKEFGFLVNSDSSGFVSGHGFSRAVEKQEEGGL